MKYLLIFVDIIKKDKITNIKNRSIKKCEKNEIVAILVKSKDQNSFKFKNPSKV